MTITADRVRADAQRLRDLTSRIHDTVELRESSPSGHAAWKAACAAFHDQFGQLSFPGGEAGWMAFLSMCDEGVERAMLFLEVDPIAFRSGYRKQVIWDRLKRCRLTPAQQQRLEAVALGYLHKRIRQEFWHMGRFMRMHASGVFWQDVEALAAISGDGAPRKARWLHLARDNKPVRRWIAAELVRAEYHPGYSPRLDF